MMLKENCGNPPPRMSSSPGTPEGIFVISTLFFIAFLTHGFIRILYFRPNVLQKRPRETLANKGNQQLDKMRNQCGNRFNSCLQGRPSNHRRGLPLWKVQETLVEPESKHAEKGSKASDADQMDQRLASASHILDKLQGLHKQRSAPHSPWPRAVWPVALSQD